MKLMINGKEEELAFPQHSNLTDIVAQYNLTEDHIIIEHNGQAYKKEAFKDVFLSEHDNIEILHFMGGG